MTKEERQRRGNASREAGRKWWASLTPDEHSAAFDKAFAARKYEHGLRIARRKYQQAGVPDKEIDILLRMPGPLRKWARKRFVLYGVLPSEIERLQETQKGRCALCDEPLPMSFHIDHDHHTGKVRGLLCGRCNLALGHIENRGDAWARRAVEWIAHHA